MSILRTLTAGLLASTALFLAAASQAAPITFTYTGTGQGTLNGMEFAPSDFTITATGDTDLRQSFFDIHTITHLTASIVIEGVGSFDFITPTHSFANLGINLVGFTRVDGGDLFTVAPGDLGGWDMLTSFGPVPGEGVLLQWDNQPVITTGGVLEFADATTPATFQAVVGNITVPEPAALALAGIGIGAIVVMCRRRT